jgi:hypothetical protein
VSARAMTAPPPPMPMPFGKFKGTQLDELPAYYVVWLSRLPDLRDPLRAAVVEELGRRVLLSPTVREPAVPAEVAVATPEIHIGEVDQDGERPPF